MGHLSAAVERQRDGQVSIDLTCDAVVHGRHSVIDRVGQPARRIQKHKRIQDLRAAGVSDERCLGLVGNDSGACAVYCW